MNIKNYLKSVDKQLTDVSPEERKKILAYLKKNLQNFMKKNQNQALIEKLGDPVEYGKSLNRHYNLLKTTDDFRLILSPNGKNGKNGNGNGNGKGRKFLRDMKFIISADMVMPVPTKDLWILGGISVLLMSLFIYALYDWGMLNLIWLLAPAFFANGAALLSRRIKILQPLAIPVDLEKKWSDGRRVIGNSKTIRGYAFGIIAAIVSAIAIFYASEYLGISIFSSLEYSILIGAVMGFGALLGDTVKSFFKRRLGFAEGKTLVFFDQTDFLIGAMIISIPFDQFPIKFILIVLAATFLLHVITNIFAFYFKLKKVPL